MINDFSNDWQFIIKIRSQSKLLIYLNKDPFSPNFIIPSPNDMLTQINPFYNIWHKIPIIWALGHSEAAKQLFMLFRARSFGATQEQLVQLYCQRIRPVLEYACPVWHPALTAAQRTDLERVQKRVCRIILGGYYNSYSTTLATFGLPSLEKKERPTHPQLWRETQGKWPPEHPPTASTIPIPDQAQCQVTTCQVPNRAIQEVNHSPCSSPVQWVVKIAVTLHF